MDINNSVNDYEFQQIADTELNCGTGVISIGRMAFHNCLNLQTVHFEEGITTIGESAFSGCTALTEIIFPASIIEIGNYAFDSCTNINNISFVPGGTEQIHLGHHVFDETNLADQIQAIVAEENQRRHLACMNEVPGQWQQLYTHAITNLDTTWPGRYRDICTRVSEVEDWHLADADLIYRLIYDANNGVAAVGQAFNNWPNNQRPPVDQYRDMLQRLRNGLTQGLADQNFLNIVAQCRGSFHNITHGMGPNSICNRIISAFLPGVVSPVMFEADFNDAYTRLCDGGYIQPVFVPPFEDAWLLRNVDLMSQLRQRLPDGPCAGALWPIDDYTRGMFVWGIHVGVDVIPNMQNQA